MNSYFAVVFSDLVRHSAIWIRVPRTAMVTILAEYRHLAQSIAGQYVDQTALAERPAETLSAEDWFLKGVGLAAAVSCSEEAECYRQALRLRPNYPEAHNKPGNPSESERRLRGGRRTLCGGATAVAAVSRGPLQLWHPAGGCRKRKRRGKPLS